MLATRIIPILLERDGHLVKGTRFNGWRTVGNALQAARIHAARGVDELLYLDIAATPAKRGPNLQMVKDLTDGMFSPVTVGGGVRRVEDVQNLLLAGADKVAIGSASRDFGLINDCTKRFGSQAIVGILNHDQGYVSRWTGDAWERSGNTGLFWAKLMEQAGVGEIMMNDVSRDGTMTGYDIDAIGMVSEALSIPVVAGGGCRDYRDMLAAIKAGASGVAAGALFQFTDSTPKEAAKYLANQGVEVRLL